jgi:hypothetical protein
VRVRLTELGLDILRSGSARTGLAVDDLIEQALRQQAGVLDEREVMRVDG